MAQCGEGGDIDINFDTCTVQPLVYSTGKYSTQVELLVVKTSQTDIRRE